RLTQSAAATRPRGGDRRAGLIMARMISRRHLITKQSAKGYMSRIKKSMANGWIATAVVAAVAVIAAWQFYLFATFRNSQGVFDPGGGTVHLWLALGAATIACVAGFLAFSVAVGYDEADDMHIIS
ncbi:MAG TPA: hypothetical protein VIP46_07135, partial [Pyrinomonadaceae bacterium]